MIECARCKNSWEYTTPNQTFICNKCGLDTANTMVCEICNGAVILEDPYGDGVCENCQQQYEYNEGQFPLLTTEQLLLLKNHNIKQTSCRHTNTRLIREGMTGMLGTVICLDCGYEREWSAY